jgi:hypothetical protein
MPSHPPILIFWPSSTLSPPVSIQNSQSTRSVLQSTSLAEPVSQRSLLSLTAQTTHSLANLQPALYEILHSQEHAGRSHTFTTLRTTLISIAGLLCAVCSGDTPTRRRFVHSPIPSGAR